MDIKKVELFEEFGKNILENLNQGNLDINDFSSGVLGIYFAVLEQTTVCPIKTFDLVKDNFMKFRNNIPKND